MTDETESAHRRTWTVAILLFVFADGLGFQMRGALLPSIESTFAVSPGLLGLISTAGTVGFMIAVLSTGLLSGRIDPDRVLLRSVGIVVAAVLLAAVSPLFPIFLVALFVRGVVTGPFRALDRAVLSHLYPSQRGRIFNRYAFVWAIGATAGPLVVTAHS